MSRQACNTGGTQTQVRWSGGTSCLAPYTKLVLLAGETTAVGEPKPGVQGREVRPPSCHCSLPGPAVVARMLCVHVAMLHAPVACRLRWLCSMHACISLSLWSMHAHHCVRRRLWRACSSLNGFAGSPRRPPWRKRCPSQQCRAAGHRPVGSRPGDGASVWPGTCTVLVSSVGGWLGRAWHGGAEGVQPPPQRRRRGVLRRTALPATRRACEHPAECGASKLSAVATLPLGHCAR
jgi:hypothetical protein